MGFNLPQWLRPLLSNLSCFNAVSATERLAMRAEQTPVQRNALGGTLNYQQ